MKKKSEDIIREIKQAHENEFNVEGKLNIGELENAAHQMHLMVESFEKEGFSRMEAIMMVIQLCRPQG